VRVVVGDLLEPSRAMSSKGDDSNVPVHVEYRFDGETR